MTKIVVLDAGPLGKIAHPKANKEIAEWFMNLLQSGAMIVIPEIADYEVRRNLILENLTLSVKRLDELKEALNYLPLTTRAMLVAAELWADVRKKGKPTAADKALDGDVILAAQTQQINIGSSDVVIATTNVKHLALFTKAVLWSEIQ